MMVAAESHSGKQDDATRLFVYQNERYVSTALRISDIFTKRSPCCVQKLLGVGHDTLLRSCQRTGDVEGWQNCHTHRYGLAANTIPKP